jgi:hypothetical protein
MIKKKEKTIMKKQALTLIFFLFCTVCIFSGELFDSLYLDYYRYTDLIGVSEPDTLGLPE